MPTWDKKKMREYQRKRRGNDSPSPKTIAENASVLIALAAGEITTGRACKLLGCTIIEVREQINAAIRSVTGENLDRLIAESEAILADGDLVTDGRDRMNEPKIDPWMNVAGNQIAEVIGGAGYSKAWQAETAAKIIAQTHRLSRISAEAIRVPGEIAMAAIFPPPPKHNPFRYMATVAISDTKGYPAAGKCVRWGGMRFNLITQMTMSEIVKCPYTMLIGAINLSALTTGEFEYLCQQMEQIGAKGSSSWMRNYREAGLIRFRPRTIPPIDSGSSDPDPIPSTT